MAASLRVKDMKLYSEADSIFADLEALGHPRGKALDVDVVSQIDQMHYHGVISVQKGADDLNIGLSSSVLEVGAGWGGPSRYIAAKTGARVTALELQEDFSSVGAELTRGCGLDALVSHVTDDFLSVDFGGARFDHVVSWLALYHIPRREEYTAKIFDLLEPGGTLFIEDLTKGTKYESVDEATLQRELFASSMVSRDDYVQSLQDAGFEVLYADTMTDDWRAFTRERLELFDARRVAFTTIHGEALFDDKRHFYSKIVEYFTADAIGGIRVAARKT